MKKTKGFTLVELLITMGILGILVTLVSGSYIGVKRKGRDAQRKHDLEQWQKALEMYFNDKRSYPEAGDLPDPGEAWRDTEVSDGALYMVMPQDPKVFGYLYESEDGTGFRIFAYLENQQDPDLLSCVVDLGYDCGGQTCNYGVSSVNLEVCE